MSVLSKKKPRFNIKNVGSYLRHVELNKKVLYLLNTQLQLYFNVSIIRFYHICGNIEQAIITRFIVM